MLSQYIHPYRSDGAFVVVGGVSVGVFAHVCHAADEDESSRRNHPRHRLILVELLLELLVVNLDCHL